MTPIQPRSTGLLYSSTEDLVCRQPDPVDYNEMVCRDDSYGAASPQAPRAQHPRFQHYLLNRSQRQVLASAFGDAPRPAASARASEPNPLTSSVWGLLAVLSPLSMTGCSDHPPLEEIPTDTEIDDPSDDETPPINPDGEDGGLGAGIQATFAVSACPLPLDLDPANASGSAIMTCGHNGLDGNTAGVGTAERIDLSSGNVTPLQLPTMLDGDETRPVSTFSSATGSGGIMYTGFAAANTVPQLQGDASLLSNSGVFVWNESNPSDATAITFPRITFASFLPDERFQLENEQTLTGLRPNRPVSMVRQGNFLFTVSDSFALDGGGALTRGPAVIHRFSVGAGGALSPAPVTTGNPLVNAGTDDPANATVLAGSFRPAAITAVGSDRIAVLIQGSDSLTAQSSIRLYTNEMGANAFDEAPNGDPVTNEITLPPGFVANRSSQLNVVDIGGEPHALVGSADGSGRIAVVNLSSSFVPSEQRVRLVNVFDDDHDLTTDHGDIANIVVRPDGAFAYAISTDGKVRAVTLTEGASFGAVGNVYNLTGSAPIDGVQQPALFSNGAILSARPLAYSKAPISN